MAEKYDDLARSILENVGGAENVTSVDNCITRLRLEVKDRLLVDEKKPSGRTVTCFGIS